MRKDDHLIFEKSVEGRKGFFFEQEEIPVLPLEEFFPVEWIRAEDPELPEVTEVEVVRHYTNLSRLNHSVDTGFYPLGSCTMKYNPRINEKVAEMEKFSELHPYQHPQTMQGALDMMFALQRSLAQISGMDLVTLQPAAGAHGEYAGMRIIRAYHEKNGDTGRKKVIVPDSAHGTNPATAVMCGYEVVEIPSSERGRVDTEALKKVLSEEVAAIMLTNPNTLGLFETDILQIAQLAHASGALLYYDGANMNAIMGKIRPGDMGFDVMHFNLHKTFSTPHGMGGPGSGPVGIKAFLKPFLPVPVVEEDPSSGKVVLKEDYPDSIGKVRTFYGNFNVLIRAMAYILSMGREGLQHASEMAVLNANYLRVKLSGLLQVPFGGSCMHEFVADGSVLKKEGLRTLDLAKALLDFGVHPPTIYFPLIVHEALMIEPTETESKDTLDAFVAEIEKILQTAKQNPQSIHDAPVSTPVRRLDEVGATRNPVVRYHK